MASPLVILKGRGSGGQLHPLRARAAPARGDSGRQHSAGSRPYTAPRRVFCFVDPAPHRYHRSSTAKSPVSDVKQSEIPPRPNASYATLATCTRAIDASHFYCKHDSAPQATVAAVSKFVKRARPCGNVCARARRAPDRARPSRAHRDGLPIDDAALAQRWQVHLVLSCLSLFSLSHGPRMPGLALDGARPHSDPSVCRGPAVGRQGSRAPLFAPSRVLTHALTSRQSNTHGSLPVRRVSVCARRLREHAPGECTLACTDIRCPGMCPQSLCS